MYQDYNKKNLKEFLESNLEDSELKLNVNFEKLQELYNEHLREIGELVNKINTLLITLKNAKETMGSFDFSSMEDLLFYLETLKDITNNRHDLSSALNEKINKFLKIIEELKFETYY